MAPVLDLHIENFTRDGVGILRDIRWQIMPGEHWVVLEGVAEVTSDAWTGEVLPNQSAYIAVGARHRLANPGTTPVRIVEVQVGDYVGEDDITRYDDEYGRTESETDE